MPAAAAVKRPRPPSPDVEPQPQPLPLRDVPEAAWEDHLLPLLTCKEAMRLVCTCKALRGVVREHFKGHLGRLELPELQAALTTFPRARSVELGYPGWRWRVEDKEALLQWLRGGGRGGHLAMVWLEVDTDTDTDGDRRSSDVIHTALQAGALHSLRGVSVGLQHETARASLTGGFLRGTHELRLSFHCDYEVGPQLAALGLVQQLPALATLVLRLSGGEDGEDAVDVHWPSFIPPSLKALVLNTYKCHSPASRSVMRALPGMLGASGAALERLEVNPPFGFESLGDGLVHLAQALRCCSPTLKGFLLSPKSYLYIGGRAQDHASQVERLRVQWEELLAGVSACRELQVLVLPLRSQVETLFPPGTAFARLTHLKISDYKREHPPDGADEMGLWDLIASGGLPALATLDVGLEGSWGSGDVRTRVAPALEAVAGTLTHLDIHKTLGTYNIECPWRGDPVEVGYAFGVAVGKLRRLKNLALDLFRDGRAYHAFAQGLAASGGDRPLPLLWRVGVVSEVADNADLLASLLLPSVRVFRSSQDDSRPALLTACALRQAGYQHTWAVNCPWRMEHAIQAIAQCIAQCRLTFIQGI
jgi:hypothetical protein